MNLIIKKEVKAEDMAKAVRHVMSTSYIYWYLRMASVFFILLAFKNNQGKLNSFMITGIILLIVSFVLPYLLYLLNKRGTQKQLKGNSMSFVYEFTNKEIKVESKYADKKGKQTISLQSLKHLKPCRHGIIIRLYSKKTVILYADDQQQNQILTWYRKNTQKN